jgi:hypothetical protein
MFSYWKKMDALSHSNKLLIAMVIGLLVTNCFLSYQVVKAPKSMRFFVTPSLALQGGEISTKGVPESSVYSFVATLLPVLNTWNGEDEGENRTKLYNYRSFISPKHFQDALSIYNAKKQLGLFKQEQIASLYEGINPDDVEQITPNQWVVNIKLRLTQRVNDKSQMVIADKVINYSVKVLRVGYSKEQNPYELVIDGYARPEQLEKNLLDDEVSNV